MPTQGVEAWENHQFPQGGMLKFTYSRRKPHVKRCYNLLSWTIYVFSDACVKIDMIQIFVRVCLDNN
jgi:hypothetical protein